VKRPERRSRQRRKADLLPQKSLDVSQLDALAKTAKYQGSPYHKRHPKESGLVEPPKPRPDKTLCDASGRFPAQRARELLAEGLRKGMVSNRFRGRWPELVWAIDDNEDTVYEARLTNEAQGEYHGYPVLTADPFVEVVRREWERRDDEH